MRCATTGRYLVDRAGKRVSAFLTGAVGRRLPSFDREYGRWVESRRPDVFVDLRLAGPGPVVVSSIGDFLDRAEPVRLVVLGAPGSGRTTLLRQVAWRTAGTSRERRRPVPVLLRPAGHAGDLTRDPGLTLPALIRRSIPALPAAEPGGWWEAALREGRCVVLLDGIDDGPDLTRWVNAQISAYPRNDYVLTARRDGDHVTGPATAVRVLPFTLGQAREFLHGWYAGVEPEPPAGSAGPAEDLFDRLAASPALDELTGSPLLLSMIAQVHRARGSLPESRADLYAEVHRMMLGHRGGEPPDGAGDRLLASAAFRMTRDRRGALSRAELLGAEPGPPAAATLDGLLAGGLLVEQERDVCELAHPALREYLAARHIRDGGLDQVLVEAVGDPWWREVTLLSYAGAGADRIVRAGLASGTPAALSLAFACAGNGPAPELRDRLDRVLLAAFDPDADSGRRRLAAGVLASRHLSRLVATPSGARICPDPVVTSLYSLFLADTGSPRPDGPCPADPATATAVTGAWSRDAVRFVAWLNEAAGGTPHRYRLPTGAELDQLADDPGPAGQVLSKAARRTWTQDTAAAAPHRWRNGGSTAVPIRHIHDQAANEMRRSTVLRTMLARTVADACRDLATAMEPIAARSAALADLLQATRAGGTGRDRNSDVRSARGTAQDIGNELLRARKSAVRLERALRNSASLDPDVATAVAAAIARMSIGAIVDDLTRASGLEWYVAIELDWNSDFGLAPATRTARDIAASADRALREVRRASAAPYRPVEPAPVVDRVLGLGPAAGPGPRSGPDVGKATGAALRNATAAVLHPAAPGDDAAPVDRFTNALVHDAVRKHEHVVVDLDIVADGVGRLVRAPLHRFPAPRWAGGVVSRIVAAAEPVLSRTRELTPGRAAAIRIPCLVIAAEANLCGQPELGARFLELAAAVTLVETRRENPDLLETILLAYT